MTSICSCIFTSARCSHVRLPLRKVVLNGAVQQEVVSACSNSYSQMGHVDKTYENLLVWVDPVVRGAPPQGGGEAPQLSDEHP